MAPEEESNIRSRQGSAAGAEGCDEHVTRRRQSRACEMVVPKGMMPGLKKEEVGDATSTSGRYLISLEGQVPPKVPTVLATK